MTVFCDVALSIHVEIWHGSGDLYPACHRGGLGSRPRQSIFYMWCTQWQWGRVSPSCSVFPLKNYSNVAFHTHLSCEVWTINPLVVAVRRLSTHSHEQQVQTDRHFRGSCCPDFQGCDFFKKQLSFPLIFPRNILQ